MPRPNSSAPSSPVPVSLSPDAVLPHRKVLRSWLSPFARQNTARALWLLGLDIGLYVVLLAGTVLCRNVLLKLSCGVLAGLVIARLFIIGHDACHQNLTSHRRLNRWLGRIAFLPSLTPYSLWDMGHNVVHHGFTNLKGVDFVWAPLTRSEYGRLTAGQRGLYRLYRSGWAPGLYYLVEIWWRRMMARNRTADAERPIFSRDCRLVTAFAALWLGAMVVAAMSTGQSVWLLALAAFVAPLVVWFTLIGFVVYVHHTHAKVSWHDNRATWQRAQPFVSTTVHLIFPWRIGTLMHHIMEHTAHHVDMSIPLYHLEDAQSRMEELLPGRIVIQHFSWSWYFDTARICKLYDFERRCWTDLTSHKTATPLCHIG